MRYVSCFSRSSCRVTVEYIDFFKIIPLSKIPVCIFEEDDG